AQPETDADGRKKVAACLRLNLGVRRLKLVTRRLKLRLQLVGGLMRKRLEVFTPLTAPRAMRRLLLLVPRQLSHSDLEQLGFLLLQRVVDSVDKGAGQRFKLLLSASEFVVAKLTLEGVEVVLSLAAHIAHRDPGLLAL